MGDRSSGKRGGGGGVGGMGMGVGDFIGLFPSDSDEEQTYGSRSHFSTAQKASAPEKKGDAAQGNGAVFPEKEGNLAQSPASGATGLAPSLTSASEKVSGGSGKLKVRRGKKKKTKAAAVEKEEGKVISSPLHTGAGDKGGDIEAACSTQPPSTLKSAEEEACDEFEVCESNQPKSRVPCRPFLNRMCDRLSPETSYRSFCTLFFLHDNL